MVKCVQQRKPYVQCKPMKKLIIFAEIEWSFLTQRHQILAQGLAEEGYTVQYVQRIPSRMPSVKKVLGLLKLFFSVLILRKKLHTRAPNSKNSVALLTSFYLPPTNKINQLVNKFIVARYYANKLRDGIAYVYTPTAADLIDYKNEHNFSVVFDIVHNWRELPWNNKGLLSCHHKLMKNADALFCDSRPLLEDLQKTYKREIELLTPGVTQDWIMQCQKFSTSLSSRRAPFNAVFYGNLRANSDIELLEFVAENNVKLTIYGIMTDEVRARLKDKVIHYPPIAQNKLVAELERFDFVILPYSNDRFSQWISPAKYYEVVALGKPIISRSKLNHLESWDKLVYNLDLDSHDVETTLTAALNDFRAQNKMQIACKLADENTWEKKIRIVHNRLELIAK